ncbi:hypothetical protein JB92DRAFT_2915312 [Gautieria morchelliformis]|nr:hypothetical protein JB92DRAFT_2915312 [Gautieria morchelliformis]
MSMQSHPKQESAAIPNAVPLPASPNATRSEFDALIELLATDEDAEESGGSLKKSEAAPHDLRDEGGRLDFFKIRALFSPDVDGVEHAQADETPVPHNPVSTRGSSQSPGKKLDLHAFESGLPPVAAESTPLSASRRLPRDDLDLIDLSSDAPPWASGLDNVDAPSLVVPTPYGGLQPNLPVGSVPGLHSNRQQSQESPTSLTNSLALAKREAATLRMRVRELEDLINKYRDQGSARQEGNYEVEDGETFAPSQAPTESHHQDIHMEVSLQHVDPQTHITTGVSQARDFNALSSAETRAVLEVGCSSFTFSAALMERLVQSLLDKLALPPSCIPSLLSGDRKGRTMPTSSLEEIYRAVDMVTFVDELVWRRSRIGSVYNNPYSEENVVALRERLELWERTVRTRR